MKYRTVFTGLLILVSQSIFSIQVHAQDAVTKKIIQEGTTNNLTQNHLDVLSNRIGGRPIGSDAYNAAVTWSSSLFESWGLDVSVEKAGETKVGFSRGPWSGKIYGSVLPGGDGIHLHFATPSYSAGTKGLQRGHVVIEPKTQADFDRVKGKLKGAWVLISGTSNGWPVERTAEADRRRDSVRILNEEIARHNNAVMYRYRMRTGARMMNLSGAEDELKDSLRKPVEEPALFYKQMVEAGILGVIQSSPVPITALWDKETVFGEHSSFDNLPTVADIKLDEHQYKYIHQLVYERHPIELEFDIRNHFRPGPVPFHNVVATIRGTKYPDEYIMVSGHLDSYDVATGGIDCGVGVTPAMESARLLSVAGAKPKRSIVFILFAGEEFGLLGAKAFVEQHKDKLEKISNLFNRDGAPLAASGVAVPKAMYDDFVKASKYISSINPDFPFTVDTIPARPWPTTTGSTDASVFAIHGVPTITFRDRDVKGYDFNYREIWHTERDLYTKSIAEYQEHTSVVQAVMIYHLANLNHLLSREGMYFKR
ncbi:MAG: M28 family peptidase [Bacteroidales bacterium]